MKVNFKPAGTIFYNDDPAIDKTIFSATFAIPTKYFYTKTIPNEINAGVKYLTQKHPNTTIDRISTQALKLYMILYDLWESPLYKVVDELETITYVYIRTDINYNGDYYPMNIAYYPKKETDKSNNPLSLTHALGHKKGQMHTFSTGTIEHDTSRVIAVDGHAMDRIVFPYKPKTNKAL
ncbi:hypothetical protein [Stenotrophomonas phage RAS14]